MTDHAFAPDPVRAAALDQEMHRELGRSVAYVLRQARGVIAFDDAAAQRLVSGLAGDLRVAPCTFARYYEAVEAIQAGDHQHAETLLAELLASQPVWDGLVVHDLGGPELGAESARLTRLMSEDADLDLGFAAPEPALSGPFRTRLAAGLALLDVGVPELGAEFRSIVRQVVLVRGEPGKAMQFDGGSHYRLWGALFLNAEFHPTPLAVAEVLAHESAHSLLFGFCTEQALVLNDAAERYRSPLRPDARPMDGIYHATFVSARMHYVMSRLAGSPLLDADERRAARDAAASDARNFAAGFGVVRAHGELTPLGAGLMHAAAQYMDEAEALV